MAWRSQAAIRDAVRSEKAGGSFSCTQGSTEADAPQITRSGGSVTTQTQPNPQTYFTCISGYGDQLRPTNA